MRQKSEIAIAGLSITAVVLLVGLILATARSDRAMAIGTLDRGGDYVMVSGQYTSDIEVVYITDIPAQRVQMYGYNSTNREFTLWDRFDLRQLPKP